MENKINLPEVNSERWLSMDNLDGEEWRPVVGHEGRYEVSNYGRVKSIKRFNPTVKRHYGGKMLRMLTDKKGYYYVNLSRGVKSQSVHRIVAKAFLPNPNNLSDVNHKDETHTNNCVDNLEWCSHSYNMNYGTVKERCRALLTNHPDTSRPVAQYDLQGNFLRVFPSLREVMRFYKTNSWKTICDVCKKRKGMHTSLGFQWRYADEGNDYTINIGLPSRRWATEKRKVYQYTKDMQFVREFNSTTEAALAVGKAPTNISEVCRGRRKTSGGYRWFYEKQ